MEQSYFLKLTGSELGIRATGFSTRANSLQEFINEAVTLLTYSCSAPKSVIVEAVTSGRFFILDDTTGDFKEEVFLSATMTPTHQKLFVKCWKAEHEATAKLNQLNERIEINNRYDKPTARLYKSVDTWSQKQSDACKPLIPLIEEGLIPEDATTICKDELGDLGGYVCDCYHELWLEHSPEGVGSVTMNIKPTCPYCGVDHSKESSVLKS